MPTPSTLKNVAQDFIEINTSEYWYIAAIEDKQRNIKRFSIKAHNSILIMASCIQTNDEWNTKKLKDVTKKLLDMCFIVGNEFILTRTYSEITMQSLHFLRCDLYEASKSEERLSDKKKSQQVDYLATIKSNNSATVEQVKKASEKLKGLTTLLSDNLPLNRMAVEMATFISELVNELSEQSVCIQAFLNKTKQEGK